MKRLAIFHVLVLIVPTVTLFLLDMAISLAFASPAEMIAFKMTLILENSVLSLILNEMLPATSDNPPVIGNLLPSFLPVSRATCRKSNNDKSLQWKKLVVMVREEGKYVLLLFLLTTGEFSGFCKDQERKTRLKEALTDGEATAVLSLASFPFCVDNSAVEQLGLDQIILFSPKGWVSHKVQPVSLWSVTNFYWPYFRKTNKWEKSINLPP